MCHGGHNVTLISLHSGRFLYRYIVTKKVKFCIMYVDYRNAKMLHLHGTFDPEKHDYRNLYRIGNDDFPYFKSNSVITNIVVHVIVRKRDLEQVCV